MRSGEGPTSGAWRLISAARGDSRTKTRNKIILSPRSAFRESHIRQSSTAACRCQPRFGPASGDS